MGKLRLTLKGIFYIAITMSLAIVFNTTTNAQSHSEEAYRWDSHSVIRGSLGAYRNILPDGSRYANFKQNEENPLIFTVPIVSEDCDTTLTLTVSAATGGSGTITNSGGCPAAAAIGSTARINNSLGVITLTQSEENVLQQRYKIMACENEQNQEECQSAAAERFSQEQASCLTAHNFQQNVAYANQYLDCLAEALGVQRPSSSVESDPLEGSERSCQIPNGWWLCQITEFISQLTDHTFVLLEPFLTVEPLDTEISPENEEDSATYAAWKGFRDIANVLLILGMLIVIFSHLTGLGVQAYHIKKGLPRLIIASLLINISFYVCALAVDISNIAGKTAQDVTEYFATSTVSQSPIFTDWEGTATRILSITPVDEEFNSLAAGIDPNASVEAENEDDNEDTEGTPETTVDEDEGEVYTDDIKPTSMLFNGVTLTGGVVLFANLAILLPVMVFALFSVFAALMILLFRQALIIVLVVISPIAFAAIMLPGTKKWYDKWQSVLIQLLLVYPIIALLFAASQLAAEVIRESAMNSGHTLMAIFTLGIQMIPLFVSPLLLKFSGSAVNQFSGMAQGKMSKPRTSVMNKARERGREMQDARSARWVAGRWGPGGRFGIPGGATVGQALPSNIFHSGKKGLEHKNKRRENEYKKASAARMGDYLRGVDDPALAQAMLSEANAEVHDINMSNLNATVDMYRRQSIPHTQMMQMALTGKGPDGKSLTDIQRRAAIRLAMHNGDEEEMLQIFEMAQTQKLGENVAQEVVKSANEEGMSSQAFHITHAVKGMAAQGEGSPEEAMAAGINAGKLSAEGAPQQSAATLERAAAALEKAAELQNSDTADPNDRRHIEASVRKDFLQTIAHGFVSDKSGNAKEGTRKQMAKLINDGIERGDLSIDDVTKILSTGKGKDKVAAFSDVFGEAMERGTFRMGEARQSAAFLQEYESNPDIRNSLFEAGVQHIGITAQSDSFTSMTGHDFNFYAEAMRHHAGNADSLDHSGMKAFAERVLRELNEGSPRGSGERATMKGVVAAYNHSAPEESRL